MVRRARRAWAVALVVAISAGCGSDGTSSPSTASSPGSTSATSASSGPSTSAAPTSAEPSTASPSTASPTVAPPTAAPTTVTPTTVGPASGVRLPADVTVTSMTWPSATDGWVLARGAAGTQLLRTSDGGATWAAVPVAGEPTQIVFADAQDGWITGAGLFQSTHDGGTTWARVTVPGAGDEFAGVAAADDAVHVAYASPSANGVRIATSPVDRDAFVPADLVLPFGAGPALDVTMSAGGGFGELIYTDRVLAGAAEIRDGRWTAWELGCPNPTPIAVAALSPGGQALTLACGPSGFGEPAPIVGADLTSGSTRWVEIAPAGDGSTGLAALALAAATDAGVRIVGFTDAAQHGALATSTDGGATWTRTDLPAGTQPSSIAHLPDGSVLLALSPSGGLKSADGSSWAPVDTSPVG